MHAPTRVLLVEHLDAIGAAPADARLRTHALRAAGYAVEGLVVGSERADDLLFPLQERRVGTGFDVLESSTAGLAQLRSRVSASRAGLVLWASATPGGGDAARVLPGDRPARWWPTGFAPERMLAGPLAPLDASFAPLAGGALPDDDERRRLSLWDGPYALVVAPPAAATAAALIEAFAEATTDREETDLVVLDHPAPALEALARRTGVAQRVHFVGPAPREAEYAWLGSAALALVPGDQPLAGGLLLRALAAGCPLLPVGEAARPLGAWLAAQGLAWRASGTSVSAAIEAALEREAAVADASARGRELARAHGPQALTARLAAVLDGGAAERRAA